MDRTVSILIGVACGFATLNFLCVLRHNKRAKMLSEIMYHATTRLLGFGAMFASNLFAFSCCGTLWFGSSLDSFETFERSLLTLILAMLGNFDSIEWKSQVEFALRLFFGAFNSISMFFVSSMFCVILNTSLSRITSADDSFDASLDLWRYTFRQIANFFGWQNLHVERPNTCSDVDWESNVVHLLGSVHKIAKETAKRTNAMKRKRQYKDKFDHHLVPLSDLVQRQDSLTSFVTTTLPFDTTHTINLKDVYANSTNT